MLKLDEYSDQYGIIPGPLWNQEACNHPPESYVCSFAVWDRGQEQRFDLYVFPQPRGAEVCIRCSDEPSDYLSPGTVGEFLRHSNDNGCRDVARRILLHYGTVSWSPES